MDETATAYAATGSASVSATKNWVLFLTRPELLGMQSRLLPPQSKPVAPYTYNILSLPIPVKALLAHVKAVALHGAKQYFTLT